MNRFTPTVHRLRGVPKGLHHRAYVVTPSNRPFADWGDSGSWVLNGEGELVGMIIARDERDGTAMFTPMENILHNIVSLTGLKPEDLSLSLF